MREIYIWSKACHENVQELTGVIMFQGLLGMVSPWMEHGNLQKYLENNPEVERYPLVSVCLDSRFWIPNHVVVRSVGGGCCVLA